jgi:RNA polymerase sigma factor (sigma-70 family)
MTPQERYESNLPLIDKAIGFVCRRSLLSGPDAEDFKQSVHLKLIADDYRVLRKFKEESSLKTYLITVVGRHLIDWRTQKWGKQRASAEALRLGEVAVRLEELMWRDGLTTDQACETLLTNHRLALERAGLRRADLERMAAVIPPRLPRRTVGEEELENRPAESERPEERVLESELRSTRQRLLAVLEKALRELPADDRLVVEMCVLGTKKIAEAARFLGLPEKPLYRKREQILARLRRTLEKAGFSWKQVAELLGMRKIRWG